jgi:hypothetical protein
LLEIGMSVPDRGTGEIGGRDTGASSERHAKQEEKEEQAQKRHREILDNCE